jgi:predicted dehydrogenase
MSVAIIGCGNIATAYARTLQPYPHITLAGATDIDLDRARSYVATYGGHVYASITDLLADKNVDIAINLTIHHAHYTVIKQCLEAGKHVYSEKPLSLSAREAWELINLSRARGVHLYCAPITLLGEAQQTAWKVIRDRKLGTVRLAYAEANASRIESWHPAPEPFYEVGALFDVGVYPLTMLTTIFGPAHRVTGVSSMLSPERIKQNGTPFQITTPDFVTAVIEFRHGGIARLTTNFYVGPQGKQKGIEFHGDKGSLYLENWQEFDSAIAYARFGETYQALPYIKEPYHGVEWSRGVVDLVDSINEERPQHIDATQAAHVVDILCAIQNSYQAAKPVVMTSEFVPPSPMSWAQ